ncbi:MAG: RNA pseudouridine synthase [bacterium]|nr:RNA pseudouridine synthase [bacterium]
MVEILFEDNHLIAAFKKSGQTVQPEPGKPLSLEDEVKAYIKVTYDKPGAIFLGVIHRLDMPVEGIVLFAKTSKSLVRMNEIFQHRKVEKIYEVWVENKLPSQSGLLTHWLRRDENKNFTKAFTSEVKGSEKAQLNYSLLVSKGKHSLLKIELLTGRKHQIRAQLSAMGCPILGDKKYGASFPFEDNYIALQSTELRFVHPVKNEPVDIVIASLKYPL